ncbi:hypothetical protein ACJRO7_028123 [Eucalyptus globulus]|uniref:Uncharacterized protein n=1 Tax=Eucalyptus globulus TaxID=34317 RepID=A0ABD3K0G7_EUCGL
MATAPEVASVIRVSGAGSAAARLPAMEPKTRAVGSYWKLFRLMGCSLTFEILDNAMEAGGLFPPRDALRRPGGNLPQGVPAWMNTRSKQFSSWAASSSGTPTKPHIATAFTMLCPIRQGPLGLNLAGTC